MKRVMIATPALDGRVEAIYAHALAETVRVGMLNGVLFLPIFVMRDALIQRARNDLVRIAMNAPDIDEVIWIDSDIAWNAEWVLRLLAHPVDVVGGTYPRKTDLGEAYVCKANPRALVTDERGLMTVDALGTGFLRTSRRALEAVWKNSPEYQNEGRICRMVFPVGIVDGQLASEDTMFFSALRSAGFAIHLDPTMTCAHVGAKTWTGDFASWAKQALPAPEAAPPLPLPNGIAGARMEEAAANA